MLCTGLRFVAFFKFFIQNVVIAFTFPLELQPYHVFLQASTILLEARAENTRKRKELSTLSSRARKLFDHFYKEQKHLSPEDGRIAHETIQRQIDLLKQENVLILVAGNLQFRSWCVIIVTSILKLHFKRSFIHFFPLLR